MNVSVDFSLRVRTSPRHRLSCLRWPRRASDRVLLVTGGGRGIGAAIARLAAARGYAVGVNYRSRRDAADAVVADDYRGRRAAPSALQADIAVEAEVVRLFEACDRELGAVSALVNNEDTDLGSL